MKNIITSVIIIYFVLISYANSQDINGIALGDSLLNNGDLKGAITEYKKACFVDLTNNRAIYRLAKALSLDGQSDSALKYLNIFISLDTAEFPLVEPAFLKTRENKNWEQFEEKLIQGLSKKFNNPYKDIDYAKKLWEMYAIDQAYMKEIINLEKKIGKDSFVVLALWELKKISCNQNAKDFEKLLEKKGWPKRSQVGEAAIESAFLIIQHSNTEHSNTNLQKKYLPEIKQRCEEGEIDCKNYAYLYDRLQVGENKPQRYGTQMRYNEETKSYEIWPLEDEDKVDELRKEVGLGCLADYVAFWGITFSPKKK